MRIREVNEEGEPVSDGLGGGVPGFFASLSSTVWCELASDGESGGVRGPAQRVCRTLEMERPGTSGSLHGQRMFLRFFGQW
jgi:hypothetical protein